VLRKTLTNIMRLFSVKREKSFYLVENLISSKPKDISLYKLAFVHKSSSATKKGGQTQNNERLEFLGDAILDALVADILYQKFPEKNEGELTNIRSKIVNRAFLNQVAQRLAFDKFVVATSNLSNSNILGNAFEAFIGALYLDQGYLVTRRFVLKHIFHGPISLSSILLEDTNYKSRLLEWSQKNKKEVEFEVIEEVLGRDNIPKFVSQVKILGETYGSGTGTSKKESHQNAARQTIERLEAEGLL